MKNSFAAWTLFFGVTLSFAQVTIEPVRVPEEIMQKLLSHNVKPVPPGDVRIGMQSVVMLNAVIGKDGDVESLQMVSGHPMLVPAAIEAVRQWKYRPYELNGIPVRVETQIEVRFASNGDADETAAGQEPSLPDMPLSIPQDKLQGHLVRQVAPIYPPLARQARIQGTVVLRVIIDKTGSVSNTQLVSGHPMLAPAAVEAVKHWRYIPYELNGETVEVKTDVQVNFKLADDPSRSIMPYAPGGGSDASGVALGGVIGGVLSSSPRGALGVERVSEAAMRPLRTQKVDPVYPGIAVQSHIQGVVALDVDINAEGNVDAVIRISGPPVLAPPAIEAVKQWKYMPYIKDGKAIAVRSTVHLEFTVEENESGVVSEPAPSEDSNSPRIEFPQRVRVSAGVSSGLLLKKVAPEYPPDARAELIQGTVLLHASIDKQGNVANLELISGHPMLAPAAIEAVRQWKYKPYLLNGIAVGVETTIQVNFVLAH